MMSGALGTTEGHLEVCGPGSHLDPGWRLRAMRPWRWCRSEELALLPGHLVTSGMG